MSSFQAALDTVASTGDVATLAFYFQDPQLIDLVAETELSLSAGVTHPNQHWFIYLRCMAPSTWKLRNVFTTAALEGHVDVLQWLFAPERVAMMPVALAHVWPLTASSAYETNNAEVLELMLAIAGSGLLAVDPHKWIDEVIRTSQTEPSPAMMRLVVAHGFYDTSGASLLQRCASFGSNEAVDYAVSEGAIMVGVPLNYGYQAQSSATITSRLLKLGMVPGPTDMFNAAILRRLDVAEVLFHEGFADVEGGEVSLHSIKALECQLPGYPPFKDELLVLTRVLLDAGGDAADGKALGEAMSCRTVDGYQMAYMSMVELLLQCGADPNALGDCNKAALQCLPLSRLEERDPDTEAIESITKCLELLLRYGADPYLNASVRVDVADRLQVSATARPTHGTFQYDFGS